MQSLLGKSAGEGMTLFEVDIDWRHGDNDDSLGSLGRW